MAEENTYGDFLAANSDAAEQQYRRSMAKHERDWAAKSKKHALTQAVLGLMSAVLILGALWLCITADTVGERVVWATLVGFNLWSLHTAAREAAKSRRDYFEATVKAKYYER